MVVQISVKVDGEFEKVVCELSSEFERTVGIYAMYDMRIDKKIISNRIERVGYMNYAKLPEAFRIEQERAIYLAHKASFKRPYDLLMELKVYRLKPINM